jgi:hypothetical protein
MITGHHALFQNQMNYINDTMSSQRVSDVLQSIDRFLEHRKRSETYHPSSSSSTRSFSRSINTNTNTESSHSHSHSFPSKRRSNASNASISRRDTSDRGSGIGTGGVSETFSLAAMLFPGNHKKLLEDPNDSILGHSPHFRGSGGNDRKNRDVDMDDVLGGLSMELGRRMTLNEGSSSGKDIGFSASN